MMKNDAHNYGIMQALAFSLAFFCFFCAIQLALFSRQYQYTTEEWVKVGENEDGQMFYEKKSAVRSISGEAMVWEKFIYSRGMYDDLVMLMPNIAGAYYSLILDRIDCRQYEYVTLRVVYKTLEGKTLHDTVVGKIKDKYKLLGYSEIPPDSLIGQVANAVCAGYSI